MSSLIRSFFIIKIIFYFQFSHADNVKDFFKDRAKRYGMAFCHDNDISPCPDKKTSVYSIPSEAIRSCYEKKKEDCRSVMAGSDYSISTKDEYQDESGQIACDVTVFVQCQ
jgi:hypothetical protein